MRFRAISLFFVVFACSGNSLKVGKDEKGGGGTTAGGSNAGGSTGQGGSSNRGGNTSGGTGGTTPAGGTGATGGTNAGAAPNGGTGASPTGGTSTGGTAPITSCTDEFPFAGEWRGNVLDFFFEPLEELRLSVREENGGAGGYVGEMVWGSGDPPPPATDPDAPYPPGIELDGGAGTGGGSSTEPWPGVPYTVVRGAGCDSAFRVSISTAQTFDSWCALQRPIDSGEWGWGCMVRSGGGGYDGVTCTVSDASGNTIASYPMWRCNLCGYVGGSSVCACDASGCVYNPEPTHVLNLTLSADQNVLSGPAPNSRCGDCTVRLERVE